MGIIGIYTVGYSASSKTLLKNQALMKKEPILNKYAQNPITNADYAIYQYRRIISHHGKIYGGIILSLFFP